MTDRTFYSQFGEDEILASIFNELQKGLCIEVGANDGVNDSTTMYFENIGWDCILVEPNPDLCQLIRESRKSRLIEAAVSDRPGEVTLYVAEGADRAHGVSTINGDQESLSKIESYGFSYREVRVKTTTLDDILNREIKEREINFISIDVEGHEIEVLKGFSIAKWSPTVVLLEDNSNFENPAVRNYMKQSGYVVFMRTGVNDWYAHASNRALVNFKNTYLYHRQKFKSRAIGNLKKIPFAVWLKRKLTISG